MKKLPPVWADCSTLLLLLLLLPPPWNFDSLLKAALLAQNIRRWCLVPRADGVSFHGAFRLLFFASKHRPNKQLQIRVRQDKSSRFLLCLAAAAASCLRRIPTSPKTASPKRTSADGVSSHGVGRSAAEKRVRHEGRD